MKISESQKPVLDAITGLELLPGLQGSQNVGIPILAAAQFLSAGGCYLIRTKMVADRGSTADSNPGDGNLRWNNANPELADVLFVSKIDAETNAIADALTSIGESVTFFVQGSGSTAARENIHVWNVVEVEDATDYVKVTVELSQSYGSGFADNDPLEITIQDPSPFYGNAVDRTGIVPILPSSGNNIPVSYLYGGDNFIGTLNEDINTWTFDDIPAGGANGKKVHFEYLFIQGATPWGITWPGSFNWCGQTPPTMPTAPGSMLFVETDSFDGGTTWIARGYILD